MPKKIIRQFTPKQKYHRWYDALMRRARKRNLEDYTERHHAIPRALGRTDEKFNLVELTFREHFIAHWLLTKMTKGEAQRKMRAALHWMCHGNGGEKQKKRQRIITAWQYDVARRAARDAQVGNKRPGMHSKKFKSDLRKRMKGNTYRKGTKDGPRSGEALENIRAIWTDELRAKVGKRLKKNNPMHRPEVVEKIKAGWTEGRRATLAKSDRVVKFRTAGSDALRGTKRPDVSARFKGKSRQFSEEHLANIRAHLNALNRSPEHISKVKAAKAKRAA